MKKSQTNIIIFSSPFEGGLLEEGGLFEGGGGGEDGGARGVFINC